MSGECEKCCNHALECTCESISRRREIDQGYNMEGYNMEWINVDDRLPKDGQDVLVYHAADFHISVGYFESDNVQFYIESDGSKFYTDNGWETEIPWAQKGNVTHWMPLPDHPK